MSRDDVADASPWRESAGPFRWFRPVVSCALVENGHLLMVRHAKGADRGRWNFPGGKVESGETLSAAAEREAWEEAGCDVRLMSVLGVYLYESRSGRPTMRVLYSAQITGGIIEPDGEEVDDTRWFDLDQLEELGDEELCKPAVLRRMIESVRNPRPWPLDRLFELSPTMVG